MPKSEAATRDFHPARIQRAKTPVSKSKTSAVSIKLPKNQVGLEIEVGGRLGKANKSAKAVLAGVGDHQTRPDPVLRRRFPRSAATS